MKIELPDNFSTTNYEDTFLWRYVDLHSLIDLVVHEQIHFTRFDHFEDGLEGLTAHTIGLKAFTQGRPLTAENVNKSLDDELQQKLIQDDFARRKQRDDETEKSQLTQYASCWFQGHKESMAMWKLYSRANGVAIKFKASELIKTVIAAAESYEGSDFQVFYCGSVDYKNIWPFDPHEMFDGKFSGLKKDRSYLHEDEFRFVVVVPVRLKGVHAHFRLPIGALTSYDLAIISNPFMEDWKYNNLRTLLGMFELEGFLTPSRMEVRG